MMIRDMITDGNLIKKGILENATNNSKKLTEVNKEERDMLKQIQQENKPAMNNKNVQDALTKGNMFDKSV